MDQPSAPSFDPALLDMENMTSDKWYALIYTRIVQQEDIFVGDFKKKVVEIINTCMNKPNATLESIQQDITNTINESQFEFEHQKFIDGIVGGTYEYLCQFIIKNSMENIKRTQCALNCFSLTNNLNYGAIKLYCNDNMLLQESSKLTQIQCSSESNNNTTDSDKAIQTYNMLNSTSANDANSMLSIKNTSTNKMETTSINNYRSTLQINNLTVDPTNDLPLLNNIHTDDNVNSVHSSEIMDDDEKTTEAIISLAMKIQQTNFNFVDDFEADDINVSNVCTTNEIQTTKCLIEQNGDQNTDPLKLEEEYKIHNSLKLLESLVNIEHDKLEVQKSLKTENEIQPNIETNDKMRFKSSKKTNIRKKNSRKLQENIHKEEEEWLPSADKQNRCSKITKTKTNKRKSRITKASKKNKKVEVQNTLNKLSTSNSNCSIEIQNDEDISLAFNGSLFSSYTKKPETIVSNVRNTESLDTTSSVGTQLAYHNTKDCLPINEFKQFLDNIESMPHDEQKNDLAVAVNNSNALFIKTCTIASTSGPNEMVDNIKNKFSSGVSGSVMKTSDYKKLYEKDRKSLFSPDVVTIKNVPLKPSKDFSNDLHIKKEYNLLQKKENQGKKPKSKIHKEESNNKTSDKKRKLSKPKVKLTNSSPKMTNNSKSKPNNTPTPLKQKSSYIRTNNKCKRLKVTNSDDKAKTNAVNNTNNESNTTDKSVNKVSSNIDTLDLQELDTRHFLENNELGEGTSRHQQLNRVNVLEYKMSNTDALEFESMPEWLRKKCELYNIKHLSIVINPFITY